MFIALLGVLAVCCVNEVVERRAISGLWLLVGADLGVMLYMWSPGAGAVPASLLICALLLAEAAAWASDRGVILDRPMRPRPGLLIAGSGVLGVGASHRAALGATLELRVTMTVMALGMFFMVLAMSLAA
jgi:hypothetical protein